MVERLFEPGKQVPSGGSAKQPTRPAATFHNADAAAHTENPTAGHAEPIAIIGMSGRFPGAGDIDSLWAALLDGRDLVTQIPKDRWSAPELDAEGACRWGGFLENAEGFDPHFFGLSPREADHIDPQQRLFLMEAWKALEDAGHAGPCADGARIGTFVGCAEGDYGTLLHDRGALINPYAFMGNACAILASRIAYHLNLTGPALAVDTACSASLVSVHLACEALRAGECDMALAGGVYVMSTPRLHRLATSAAMLSPTGSCHAFGADADGFVPSEAVAALLLKPLDAAVADGDRVIAVIEASGLNQDGRSNGITAPSAPSQAALLKRIHTRADIDPSTIGLIEAHGTGTRLGDPIEFQALTDAFGDQPAGQCALGSIKSNIGHAQLAAGIAGLVKLVLSVSRAKIPPTLHADAVNPHLDLDASAFRLPKAAENWTGDVRRGAVNAFGFAGTNAHMVVRSHDAPVRASDAHIPTLLLVSGSDEAELKDTAARLARTLEGANHRLADVGLTLISGRAHHLCRRAVVADTLSGFVTALEAIARGEPARPARTDLVTVAPALIGRLPEHASNAGEGTRKALDVLAQAYEGGAPVTPDWMRTLMDRPARRISLPGTQFRLRRCWIDTPATAQATAPGTVIRYEIAADDPLPESHRVGSRAVVPGTALLLAALGDASGLANIRFSAMAERKNSSALPLTATTDGDTVTLTDEAETTLLTASRRDASAQDFPSKDFPQFDAASQRRAKALPGRFKAAGLDYGASLQGIKQISASGDHVRARISCNDGRPRFGVTDVTAELLDIACQCVAALLPDDGPLPLMVPASLEGFALLRPLDTEAEVRLTRTAGSPGGRHLTVDITLMDPAGNPAAILRGLTLRTPNDAAQGTTLMMVPDWSDPEPLPTAIVAPAHRLTIAAPARGEAPMQTATRILAPALDFCRTRMADLQAGRPIRLVCNAAADDLDPLAAFWRSAAAEYPSLGVACDALDGVDAECADTLVPDAGATVAKRTQQGVCRRILREQAPVTPFDFSTLAPGAIAITGGGAIGDGLARHLARRTGMTVGLIGRSQEDGRSDRLGSGTILRLAADVTDETSLSRALQNLRECGPIRLVIHTAGITDDAPLADLTKNSTLLDRILAPKLAGCAQVDRLTRSDPLEGFVVFSGLVAHTGNSGQAAYATANAILERWAMHRDSPGATRAIAWPLWAEGGMAIPDRLRETLERATGLTPMPTAAGIEALALALGGDDRCLVVAHGARTRLLEALCPQPVAASAKNTRDLSGLREAFCAKILDIVGQSLRVDGAAVDLETPLADYGLDSIAVTALVDDLNRQTGAKLNPTLFFEARSLDAIVTHALNAWPGAIATALDWAPVARAPSSDKPDAPAQLLQTPPIAAIHEAPPPHGTRDMAEPVAIVGLDLRFPGADDPESLWQVLLDGSSQVGEVPRERWDWQAQPDGPQPALRWGGFIEAIDRFDAGFFGIAPLEASAMDPQQRLLLQSAWRAIESAGHGPRSLAGSRTGVFIGCAGYDYMTLLNRSGGAPQGWNATGVAPSLMANRLSYTLDLRGPSETVDTACSSSLVALDRAMKALRSGACEAAIVGASSAMLAPDLHTAFARAGLLSPSGRCHAFDAAADGYTRGEGVAALYLKPLSQARRDGDPILGLVLGSAVNHGGHGTSLTAPNAQAQADVLRAAWTDAGITPAEIGYIEAHGTGTALGDPVEIRGLTAALADASEAAEQGSIAVSTVKSQLGHLEATAGLAGVIAALLAIRHGLRPGNPQIRERNPLLALSGTALSLPRETTPWPRRERRIAGVSSFGFGGTNAHVVIAAAGEKATVPDDSRPALIVLSARTKTDLAARAADLATWIVKQGALADTEAADARAPLTALIADHLRLAPDAVSLDETLAELGFDAPLLRGLGQALQDRFGDAASRLPLSVDTTPAQIARSLGPAAYSTDDGACPTLADLAYTLQLGRDAMAHRLAFIANSLNEVHTTLEALGEKTAPNIWEGVAERAKPGMAKLFSRETGRALIAQTAAEGSLEELATLWCGGATIPWAALWDTPRRRLALPAYRFAGERHWLAEIKPAGAPIKILCPGWQKTTLPDAVDFAPTDSAGPLPNDQPVVIRLDETSDPQAHIARLAASVRTAIEAGSLRLAVLVAGHTPQAAAMAEAFAGLFMAWAREVPSLRAIAAFGDGAAAGNLAATTQTLPAGSLIRLNGDDASLQVLRETPAPTDALDIAGRVFLITGGTGRIGRLLVDHLLDRGAAGIVTMNRTATPSDKARALAFAGDCAHPGDVRAALRLARDAFGQIDTIVHAAGVLSDGLMQGKGLVGLPAVLAPKIGGLDALLAEADGLPILAFSSLAGWLGSPSQAAYAAANRYMDGYAAALGSARLRTIAWPLWDEADAATPEARDIMRRELGLETLETRQAWEVMGPATAVSLAVPAADDAPVLSLLTSTQVTAPVTHPSNRSARVLIAAALGMKTPPPGDARLGEIGFTSLTAVRLASDLRTQCGLDWPLKRFFDHDTVQELSATLDEALDGASMREDARPEPTIPQFASTPQRSEGPLASGQRDLLLHQFMTPHSYAYNLPVLFRIEHSLDTDSVRDALTHLRRRHPLLRDTYRRDGDNFLRVPGEDTDLSFEQVTAPAGDDTAQIEWLRDLARRPFRLDRDPPLRATLVTNLNHAPRALLLTLHHITVDGLSLAILQQDLDALVAGEHLSALSDSYGNFVEVQTRFRASDEGQAMLAWWQAALEGPLPPLDLPSVVRPPRVRLHPQGSHRVTMLDADTAASLKSRWVGGGTTMAALTLAAWTAVLGRFAPSGTVRLMTPFANRPDRRFDDTVGLFMNPVLVDIATTEYGCFSSLLTKTASVLRDAIEHGQTPLADVLALLSRNGRPPALHEAAHAGFLYQNWHVVSHGPLTRLDTLHHEGDFTVALEVIDTADGLRLLLKHDAAFVDTETAEWLLEKTRTLLERLINDDPALATLDAADAGDRTRIDSWNAATHDRTPRVPVQALLRRHASATPDRVAIVCGAETWSYAQADRHANRVANALRTAGAGAGDIVGARMDRGAALPSVLLGVLRAGAAYLPLDPAFPQARVTYMLKDSGARFLIDLTNEPLAESNLTMIRPAAIADAPETPANMPQSGALAYVLYTSGSTGTPKGVRIPRAALNNFLTSMAQRPGLDPDDRMLALTTVSFDISGLELLLPLTVGASVEIVSSAQARDARALRDRLENGAITVAQATPATWRMVLAAGWTGGGLKRLLVGGEALTNDLAETLASHVPEVWNMYGPTETTIWSTCGHLEAGKRISAGLPIANTSLHILDEDLSPRAIGATGELAIGGDGLADGYEGLDDLTTERFVSITAKDGSVTRVYRTGDLARLLADGSLEILGRTDAQAKLRGHRIEPGEIEAAIMRLFGCHDCAALVRPSTGGLDELVAFCVPGPRPIPPAAERMKALAAWLPDHMVPTRWMGLETLPRTLNDKTNRKALANLPLTTDIKPPAQSVSARDAIIRSVDIDGTIRRLIADITGRSADDLDEKVPLTLFGLDSLRVVRLADDLDDATGLDVTPTDIFNAGHIRGLADDLIARLPATPNTLATPSTVGGVQARETDIAVIGLSGRFPDAPDPNTLWQNLMAGHTAFRPVPNTRWDVDSIFDARRNQPGCSYSRVAALLDDITRFDPAAFAMTEQEAQSTDPQQRLFLIESLRALKDAGLDPAALRGSSCGVFTGATFGDYHRLLEASGRMDAFAMAGNSPSLIPARLAYHLDLKGQATAVDTACSASLVAVHDACRALIQGEASMAVAGGVYLMTTSLAQVLSAGANVLSADELCRPFDARGDGIVLGEAVAALVLKPLAKAIADGNPIRGIIKGTAVNQDGRTAGITAPSAPSQAAVITQALVNAGVDPDTISYVEAHGTGTRLGDPIEIDGLRRAYGDETTTPKLLGSIKANIGHAYQAAGIAGLVKAILCLENGIVPPQPGVETINPLLKLEHTAFRVPLKATELQGIKGAPLRAGVSSFGFSGTNAHVVLESWPERHPRPHQDRLETGRRCWVDAAPEAPASPVSIVTRRADAVRPAAPDASDKIRAELAALSGLGANAIAGDAALEADLGLDSIKLMGLASRFGISTDLGQLHTLDDLLTAAGAEARPDPISETAPLSNAAQSGAPVTLADAQALFLLGHHLIDSSSLCSWLRLDGPLDRDRLARAWQRMVNDNPGLRVIAELKPEATRLGETQARLLSGVTVPEITLSDLSHLPPEEQDAALQAAFEDGLNREWDLSQWPLHQFTLHDLGEDRHALFLTNEHFISDGIGNQLILATLLQTYAALGGSGTMPDALSNEAFRDIQRRLANHGRQQDAPTTGGASFGWMPDGAEIRGHRPRFSVSVTETGREDTAALERAAAALGGTLNALLILALARAASRTALPQSGTVTIQMPTSGRAVADIDAGQVIGCYAQNLPVDLSESLINAPWQQALPEFSYQITALLAAEEDWRVTASLAATILSDVPVEQGRVPERTRPMFRSKLRSNLYAPFIGDTGIASSYGDLTVSGYRAGTVNGAATIDVLHEIFDGRLHGSWNFDANSFPPGAIDALRQAFSEELQATRAAATDHTPPHGPSRGSRGNVPPMLVEAAEAVLGEALHEDAGTRDLAEIGIDSLRKMRMLTHLPGEIRRDAEKRRALIGATTLSGMADALGLESATSDHPLPINAILDQMTARPDAPAVTGPDGSFTYAELDKASARIAAMLREYGVLPGDRVGLLFERGCGFVATMLGTLRAGAAYVPIDPAYPPDRMAYIAEHARLAALATSPDLASWAGGLTANTPDTAVVVIDGPSLTGDAPAMPVAHSPAPNDLMVILYTSGSTGRPKGVALDHAGYANRLAWHQKQFSLQPGESIAQKTSVCFDISVWELFWPLMHGGILEAIDADSVRDPWSQALIVRERPVSVMHFVPSMFEEFIAALEIEQDAGEDIAFPDLRWVVLSGEALPMPVVRRWFKLLGDGAPPLANLYGPTEASIDVTCEVIAQMPPETETRISIGTVIDGVQLFVLDDDANPLGDGEMGELCIGGVQLAHGYFDQPELTNKAFISFHNSALVGDKVYRTGDLVRRGSDGRFDYLGRKDSQVKIRGHRIELGEIEAVLSEIPGIRQAAVVVEECDGINSALIAHIAPEHADSEAAIAHCRGKLPLYMVPNRIHTHAHLPVTPNGKMDRKALVHKAVFDRKPEGKLAPLAPAQRWLLQHFPEPYQWWGYIRFHVHRTLDESLIIRAFAALSNRHEALRTVYRLDGTGETRQLVLETAGPLMVTVRDADTLSALTNFSAITTELRETCDKFEISKAPLDAALILRHTVDHFEFCLVNHHISGDFVSGDILFRDFWTAYDSLEAGHEPFQGTLPPPGPTDFATALAELEADGTLDADRAFWGKTVAESEGFAFPADHPEAPNREDDTQTIERVLAADVSRLLRVETRKRLGLALYPVLCGPLYQTLAQMTGGNKAVLSHRVTGRCTLGGLDVTGSVGNYAVHFPLPLATDHLDTDDLCRAVAAQLASVPHAGATYDWFGKSLGEGAYPDECLTPLRVNYLGVLPPDESGVFRFSREHHNQRLTPPEQIRSADLELHLAVSGDQLSLRLSYAETRWNTARLEALLDEYMRRLEALARMSHA